MGYIQCIIYIYIRTNSFGCWFHKVFLFNQRHGMFIPVREHILQVEASNRRRCSMISAIKTGTKTHCAMVFPTTVCRLQATQCGCLTATWRAKPPWRGKSSSKWTPWTRSWWKSSTSVGGRASKGWHHVVTGSLPRLDAKEWHAANKQRKSQVYGYILRSNWLVVSNIF